MVILLQQYQGTVDIVVLFTVCLVIPFIIWELAGKLVKQEQEQAQKTFTYANYYNPKQAITFDIK